MSNAVTSDLGGYRSLGARDARYRPYGRRYAGSDAGFAAGRGPRAGSGPGPPAGPPAGVASRNPPWLRWPPPTGPPALR